MDLRTVDGQFRVPATLDTVPNHPVESQESFYQWVIGRLRALLRSQKVEVTVYGVEHVPTTGGGLFAINHTGYYDFIFGGVPGYLRGKRLVRFMAKKEVFDKPVVGHAMRAMQHIPVDRSNGRSSVDEAVQRIKKGQLLGIFPESTISRSFELADFKNGAARIAQHADAPLIPMVIWGSQRLWTKGRKKELGRNGFPVIIRVGAPIDTSGEPDAVVDKLKASMQELLDESRAEYNERFGPFGDGADWLPASMGGSAPTLEEARAIDAKRKADKKAKRERKIGRRVHKALKRATSKE
ncbi:lysophospholipid acyltransferase family protein [Corynebacterium cystitidis]|uniref:lysophospholipid acyltransferase family protein n=1 Tax=Corynebacterium cystitidis TaxID=35757 RepID=UPI00211EF38E|nr:lysophospholipid acyltransferase family protein [Corynebacterium cystitidis]